MALPASVYCMKCRRPSPVRTPTVRLTASKRWRLEGTCAVCAGAVGVFIPKAQAPS